MFAVEQTVGTILCCQCGVAIQPNAANMCVNCIRSQVDITEGIQKQVTILYCKECNRYLQPPKAWVRADLESKELLTFCIKKLKGLQKVKLVDAGFIWTEPHSKRIKVKLTIQKEVLGGAILQQAFAAEFVVEYHMCEACARTAANSDQWNACVQVRQHVGHKRTFFLLEQMILKHNAHANTLNIREAPDGVDFFYSSRSHALKFIEFLNSVVPMKSRHDKQLVSHDEHTGNYNYKFTFSIKMVPICKEDLCLLPHKVYNGLGAMGPLVLCTHVTNTVHLLDPLTLRVAHVDAPAYYRSPYTAVLAAKQLTEYVVLDSELLGPTQGKWALADCQVARVADFGKNDTVLHTRTHLGNLLQAGDLVLGYDMTTANLVDPEFEKYRGKLQLPDCVLVRKSYAEKRRKRRQKGKQRAWKLQHMEVEKDETVKKNKGDLEREEAERERFMEELEEDADLRANIRLYRDPTVLPADPHAQAHQEEAMVSDDDDDDVPEVPLEELLNSLTIADAGHHHQHNPFEDPGDYEDDDDDEMES